MSFIDRLTAEQLDDFRGAYMSEPIPLHLADVTRPFVYDRQFGLFYVPGGKHPFAMSFLLALQHNCADGIEVSELLGIDYGHGTAERWLTQTPGTAFKSSVSKTIYVGALHHINAIERRVFGSVECILD